MRSAWLAFALLLAVGCVQHAQPEAPSPNEAPNQSQPLAAGNITPPLNVTVANASINVTVTNASMNATSANATDQTAPEAVQKGLPFGNYSLVLDDVSVTPETCGIFSIYAKNGTVLRQFVSCPVESVFWLSPEGHLYRIRVEKVAAGYTKEEKWAQVSIFG